MEERILYRSLACRRHLRHDMAVPTVPLCSNAVVNGKKTQEIVEETPKVINVMQLSQQHLLVFVSALLDGSRSIFVPDVIGFCAASPLSSALLETMR